MASGLQKLKIKNLDKNTEITVDFNPKEFTVDKSVSWQEHRATGNNAPQLEFTTGEPRTTSLELWFDSSTMSSPTDVRLRTKQIEELTLIDREKHRPPVIKVTWGSFELTCTITRLSQKFNMFSSDGFPIRAVVTVGLKEYFDVKKEYENKSPDHTRAHVVKAGERVDSIASEFYESPVHWKLIAEANNLEDPTRIPAGTNLTLPRLY